MNFLYRLIKFLNQKFKSFTSQYLGVILFKINKITFGKGIYINGLPEMSIQGEFTIGKNFKINSRIGANPIGRTFTCMFIVRKNATLVIGNNVGISGTTIICQKSIILGNNIKIGGNVCIYDTNFHSLNPLLRMSTKTDIEDTIKKEVIIKDNVFIGAHSTILKGVTIGENSIIGACSVISKNIPPNEIWVGNPAKFIKKIDI
ncbi:MAG: acyltransferase [Sulfurimonas sp.]